MNWGGGAKFMQVEIDLGNGFVDIGTQQMLSVPYAIYSGAAQNAQTAGNGISGISVTGDTLFLSNGTFVIVPGISAANGPDVVQGCTSNAACNYNSMATHDDGSCYFIGSACNDGNSNTFSDVYNAGCICEGDTVGTGPLNITTALIPAGTFTMGSPTTEVSRGADEVQHQVTLSAFRMSTYEITNAQYATFLNANAIGANGLYAAGAYPTQPLIYSSSSWGLIWTGTQWQPIAGKENFPVVNVTWYGATQFASYAGGRLPTEAEWEYACRAGTTTPFNTGNCLDYTQANYYWAAPYPGCSGSPTNYPNQTQTVDSYAPNAYGLYNMHGNVQEWCSDWYDGYATGAQTNPTGPSTGPGRVFRGGHAGMFARGCRSAERNYDDPGTNTTNNNSAFGFRLAFLP